MRINTTYCSQKQNISVYGIKAITWNPQRNVHQISDWKFDEEFKTTIQGKLQEVKMFLTTKRNRPVNNAVVIERLLDYCIVDF